MVTHRLMLACSHCNSCRPIAIISYHSDLVFDWKGFSEVEGLVSAGSSPFLIHLMSFWGFDFEEEDNEFDAFRLPKSSSNDRRSTSQRQTSDSLST